MEKLIKKNSRRKRPNKGEVSSTHLQLIESISNLDRKQRVKEPDENESNVRVSEFYKVKSEVRDENEKKISDLTKKSGKKSRQGKSSKDKTPKNPKVLSKPLEKPDLEKIARITRYEHSKKEMQKWNSVVAQQRTAEHISFPAECAPTKSYPERLFHQGFRIQSDLEKALDALDSKPSSENIQKENDSELTLEEILLRRAETAKFRAEQSYKISKAHRKKKIKSKKYHRIQKKNKLKEQLKELEQLEKTDSAAALEKLEYIEKIRSQERMTLRHKNTGHWARNKLIRAKYDKETRQELSRQLSIGRDLSHKIMITNSDDDDDDAVDDDIPLTTSENPWINEMKNKSRINKANPPDNCENQLQSVNLKSQTPDENLVESDVLHNDDGDKQENGYELLHEAFFDEDVVEDFRKEKEEEIEKNKPVDVNLTLPGWGRWGGPNIKQSNKLKRKFIMKFSKDTVRKDENKGNVIINAECNSSIKKYQVKKLPFPFTNVKDYEASMRAPIGRDFVPENTFRKLIKPSFRTKMGQIIQPMDEDCSLNIKKKIKR